MLLCEKKILRLKKNVSHWSTQSEDASLQVPPSLGGDLPSPAPQVSDYLCSLP